MFQVRVDRKKIQRYQNVVTAFNELWEKKALEAYGGIGSHCISSMPYII